MIGNSIISTKPATKVLLCPVILLDRSQMMDTNWLRSGVFGRSYS